MQQTVTRWLGDRFPLYEYMIELNKLVDLCSYYALRCKPTILFQMISRYCLNPSPVTGTDRKIVSRMLAPIRLDVTEEEQKSTECQRMAELMHEVLASINMTKLTLTLFW
jgi:hypothetical protein